jgi:hypothetical protein
MCGFNGPTLAVHFHSILIALPPVSLLIWQITNTELLLVSYGMFEMELELNPVDIIFKLRSRRLSILPLLQSGLIKLFNLQICSGVAIQFIVYTYVYKLK